MPELFVAGESDRGKVTIRHGDVLNDPAATSKNLGHSSAEWEELSLYQYPRWYRVNVVPERLQIVGGISTARLLHSIFGLLVFTSKLYAPDVRWSSQYKY